MRLKKLKNQPINKVLHELVEHFGSQGKMAKALGITQQYVSDMVNGKADFPTLYAVKIERLTKGKYTVEMLLSDKKKQFLIIPEEESTDNTN